MMVPANQHSNLAHYNADWDSYNHGSKSKFKRPCPRYKGKQINHTHRCHTCTAKETDDSV